MTTKVLMNKHILITRAQHQNQELKERLEAKGAHVLVLPCLTIKISPKFTTQYNIYESFLIEADAWIITSQNTLLFADKLLTKVYDKREKKPDIIAIGQKTQAKLNALHFHHVYIPDVAFSSEGLLKRIDDFKWEHNKIALLTGAQSRDLIKKSLVNGRYYLYEIEVYERLCPHYSADELEKLLAFSIDFVIVMSVETLKNLIFIMKEKCYLIKHTQMIVLSHRIAEIAKEHGFTKIRVASEASTQGILDAIELQEE